MKTAPTTSAMKLLSRCFKSSRAALLTVALLLAAALPASAQYTWKSAPGSSDWNTYSNWQGYYPFWEGAVPNDTAYFASSAGTSVTFSASSFVTTIYNIVFYADAPAYTLTALAGGNNFEVLGGAIANYSANTQTFRSDEVSAIQLFGTTVGSNISFYNVGSKDSFIGGDLRFTGASSAGGATIFNEGSDSSWGGTTEFSTGSTAGNATITNGGGTTQGGGLTFFGSSNAGHATITNNIAQRAGYTQFLGNSSANTATINNQGGNADSGMNQAGTNFGDTSRAGSATFYNNGSTATNAFGGFTSFSGTSTASNGTFTNGASSVSGGGGGYTNFNLHSDAGSATFTNEGGGAAGIGYDGRSLGGRVEFNQTSSAGSATFTSNGGTVSGALGGYMKFWDTSTASSSSITNNGSTVSGAYGGLTEFTGTSTASNATLIANGGSNGGGGGGFIFYGNSSGGTARLAANGNGYLDISLLHSSGMNIGSIEGSGNFYLGSKSLTMGSNNLSTEVSGVIQNGSGGTGGSLVKAGAGTLTLSGNNSYTGSTTVSNGALKVNGSIASSSGVSVASGATLGGDGAVSTISGAGAVAPGGSQILTATQLDPGAGMSFNFQLSQQTPAWSNASASGNDVLHLTNATPLAAALTSANKINVDFSGVAGGLASGQLYYGGFFLNSSVTLGTPIFNFTGTGNETVHYMSLANVSSANFGTGTVTNGKVMEFAVTDKLTTTTTTTPISVGANFSSAIAPVTAVGGFGSTATIADGVSSGNSTVTVGFTGNSGNFGSIASDVATVSGMANKGTGALGQTLTDKFVLKLSFDVNAANALGGASAMDILWHNPVTDAWVNAIFGNSDNGAGATFVSGAYNQASDFNLSTYGVDTIHGYAWAVLDHNSDFGVGNPAITPLKTDTVPEPSTWALLAGGCASLLAVRRRRS